MDIHQEEIKKAIAVWETAVAQEYAAESALEAAKKSSSDAYDAMRAKIADSVGEDTRVVVFGDRDYVHMWFSDTDKGFMWAYPRRHVRFLIGDYKDGRVEWTMPGAK